MDGSHEYAPSNTINADTFKQGVDDMNSNFNVIKWAVPTSIFIVLLGLAPAGASTIMGEVIGSLGGSAGPGAIIFATYKYLEAEKLVWDIYGRGIQ